MEDNIEAKYTRDINCLREKDKNVRISSLKRLFQVLPNETQDNVHQLFAQKLKSPLLDLLKDPSDKCKELSVDILSVLIKSKRILSDDIPAIITALHSRLGIDPCPETCEEVRISELKLLIDIIQEYSSAVHPILSEVTDILSKLGKDKCPGIKNIVSNGIIFLCTNGFRFSSKKLLDGIRNNLNHQQFKVRALALEAIGALSLTEIGIAEELYNDFKKIQVDRRVEVRQTNYKIITEILLYIAYPELKKIEEKFVYLILGGFSDEECSINISECLSKVFARIRQSASEYDEDCSDAVNENWLIKRNLKGIIETGLGDIQEWTIQDYYRSRAVNSIGYSILMAQTDILNHLEKILKVFFKAHSSSEDTKYTELLENVSRSISKYSPFPDILKIITKLFSEGTTTQEKSSGFKIISKMISSLEKTPENAGLSVLFVTNEENYLEQSLFLSLHACIEEILSVFESLCIEHMHRLFYSILILENILKSKAQSSMVSLAGYCNYSDVSELYSIQLPLTLPRILIYYKGWECGSEGRSQFRNLIVRSGSGIKAYWDQVIDVLVVNSARDKDNEVRYDMLVVLDAIVSCQDLKEFVRKTGKIILNKIITPTCSWKVGSSSVQIRISSLICLQKVLESQSLDDTTLWECWENFFQGVKGCMDDDWDYELRLSGVNCITPMLKNYSKTFPTKCLSEVQDELIKRLDDSLDTIRILVSEPLKLALNIFISTNKAFESLEKYTKILFLHLDDDNPSIQSRMLEVLGLLYDWKQDQVHSIALEKQAKQRHPELIEILIEKHKKIT